MDFSDPSLLALLGAFVAVVLLLLRRQDDTDVAKSQPRTAPEGAAGGPAREASQDNLEDDASHGLPPGAALNVDSASVVITDPTGAKEGPIVVRRGGQVSSRKASSRSSAELASIGDLLARTILGVSSFNTPRTMKQGASAVVRFRVWPHDLPSPPMSRETKPIGLGDDLEAVLTGDGFAIAPPHGVTKPILRDKAQEWTWKVRAQKTGDQYLDLTLSSYIELDGRLLPADISPETRRVTVTVTPLGVLATHWQFVLTTGLTLAGIALAYLALR